MNKTKETTAHKELNALRSALMEGELSGNAGKLNMKEIRFEIKTELSVD